MLCCLLVGQRGDDNVMLQRIDLRCYRFHITASDALSAGRSRVSVA